MHMVASVSLPPPSLSSSAAVPVMRAGHAERVAEHNRATVRVDVRGILGGAELAEHRYDLRGEGFIRFDDIE